MVAQVDTGGKLKQSKSENKSYPFAEFEFCVLVVLQISVKIFKSTVPVQIWSECATVFIKLPRKFGPQKYCSKQPKVKCYSLG